MNSQDPAETFRQEARELLETLESNLLDLEQDPDDRDLVNSAFRALHTIKGSGAMFGFAALAAFVHEFETVFDRVRRGGHAVDTALVRVGLDACDHIAALVDGNGGGGGGGGGSGEPAAGDAILARLRDCVGDGPGAEGAVATPAMPGLPARAPASGGGEGAAGTRWRLVFRLPQDSLAHGTNPLLLLEELGRIGPARVTALTDDIPVLDALDPEVPHVGWQIDIEAEDPAEAIDDAFLFLRDGLEMSLTRLGAGAAAPAAGAGRELAAAGDARPSVARTGPPGGGATRRDAPTLGRAEGERAAASSLRVPAERLDELMDRVGELVIAQARLSQIAADGSDPALKTVSEELERLSSGLRDTTMGIRMLPIGTLFGRFRRLVHDLSGELGKPIDFTATGEETELDKTMIERLADPLVHLIRNAVDHGLEGAARRAEAGKPERGQVRLSAVYSGAEVTISVSDDGAGLDAARIRARAEESGIIGPDARLGEQEVYQLIFAPGFSTASEVTSLSGRGVGMDVVRRTIDGLRGSIEVATERGRGTTITLRLPLTLAIIDGMLVRVGGGRYTIPLAAVEECVELPDGIEGHAKGRNFLDIRGSLVPYLRLREVFGTDVPAEPYQKVVIVSSGEGRVGLVVDQIIGNNQTVIKQLTKLHSGVRSFSGATILGDGSVALILDTAFLVASGQAGAERNAMTGRAA